MIGRRRAARPLGDCYPCVVREKARAIGAEVEQPQQPIRAATVLVQGTGTCQECLLVKHAPAGKRARAAGLVIPQ